MGNSSNFVPALERLADQFKKLPGIGKKSAYRIAYHILDYSEEQIREFSDALLDAKTKIRRCSICQNICDREICPICSSQSRNHNLICVVEDPRDVAAIEKINEFDGVFHVLGGVISPLDGKGPDSLSIKELLERIKKLTSEKDACVEVILATNPNVEGEATAMYISRLLKPLGVKVTRLAKGIPVGGDLEYADGVTLFKAIEGRVEM